MTTAVELAAVIAMAIVLAHGCWWSVLSLLAVRKPVTTEIRLERHPSFVVIVPAHNEAALIGTCLESLQRAGQGNDHELLVVADNCSDATATIARQLTATVIERTDPVRRGKSYALDVALRTLIARPTPPEAVIFVDADSTVSVNFFEAIADRLARGARVVQVHYAAAPGSSTLGRLRRLAFLLVHWSRPLGASRIGLGTTLKGNGMAMHWDVASAGLGGFGLAEDAAMTLSLATRGLSVAFEPRAVVTGYMAQEYKEAAIQDERWERGRRGLTRRALLTGVVCLSRGQLRVAAGAFDIATLPLSLLVLFGGGAGAAATAGLAPAWLAAAALGSLLTYVGFGLAAARAEARDLIALAGVPRFILHKALVYCRTVGRTNVPWTRTERR